MPLGEIQAAKLKNERCKGRPAGRQDGWTSVAEYLLFVAVLTAMVRPLGSYLAKVFAYEATFLDRAVVPVERVIVRLVGPAAERPMKWREYFFAFVSFGIAGAAFVFFILKLQEVLPFYGLLGKDVLSTPMTDDLALNTAISFGYDHHLASLRRRNDDELFQPDCRAGVAELSRRSCGTRDRNRLHSGISIDGGGVLGNFWRDVIRACCGCCCRSASLAR